PFTTQDDRNNPRLRKTVIPKVYRKIVTIIHVAAQEGYKTVILGALGCGAFKNPPSDVANIFSAVLSQYAGYIPEVVFAIKATGAKDDNFTIFSNILKKEYIKHPQVEPSSWEKPLELCLHGGRCNDLTTEHQTKHAHPPKCPSGM